jgi:hypothetical protein
MKIRPLLLILAVFIAIGLWNFSAPPGPKDAAIEPAKSAASRPSLGPAQVRERATREGLEVREVENDLGSRWEVEALAPLEPAIVQPDGGQPLPVGPQLEIRVVHQAGRAPVVGIPVFVLEHDKRLGAPHEWTQVLQTEGLGPMVERFGITRRTDANGSCRIPLPQGGCFLRANGLGLIGAINMEVEPTNPLVLEVATVAGHRIFAHGPSGDALAGLRVGLAPLESTQSGKAPLFFFAVAETAGSPASAVLVAPPELKLNQEFRGLTPGVLAIGLFAVPVAAELSDPLGSGEEIHLQLPECGSVVLKLKDPLDWQSSPKIYELAIEGGASYRLPIALDQGLGQSDWVQFGLRIEVSSTELGTGRYERRSLGVFDGPTAENPVVEFLLEPPPVPVILGTAVGPDGRPLDRQRLELSLLRRGTPRGQGNPGPAENGHSGQEPVDLEYDSDLGPAEPLANVHTDDRGRFELRAQWLPYLRDHARIGQAYAVRVEAVSGATLIGDIDVPIAAFEGDAPRVELGELELQDVPMLLAGRVLDRAGQPVSGLLTYADCDGAEDRALQDRWRLKTVRIGRDGRFEIRQRSSKRQVRLEFQGDWHVSREPVFASAGQAGFDFIVSGSGGLVYDLILPATPPTIFFVANLQIELLAVGDQAPDPTRQHSLRPRAQAGDGRYSMRGIPEGNYRLNVKLGDLALTEYDRPEVVIRSGELTDLGRIDLSRGLTILDLRFDPQPPESKLPWVDLDLDERHRWVLVGRNLPSTLRLRGEQGVMEGVVEGPILLVPGKQ